MPFSADLLSNAQLPFTLSVAPLALPHPEDDPVQVRALPAIGVGRSYEFGLGASVPEAVSVSQ